MDLYLRREVREFRDDLEARVKELEAKIAALLDKARAVEKVDDKSQAKT